MVQMISGRNAASSLHFWYHKYLLLVVLVKDAAQKKEIKIRIFCISIKCTHNSKWKQGNENLFWGQGLSCPRLVSISPRLTLSHGLCTTTLNFLLFVAAMKARGGDTCLSTSTLEADVEESGG